VTMAAQEEATRELLLPDGKIRIVPSMLAADFGDLRSAMKNSGSSWVSIDVMDGHFVPNLSFGVDHVKALRKGSDVYMDAHLMVSDPQLHAPVFADAGADWVTFHIEACKEPQALIAQLKDMGVGVGLAVKPGTPVETILPYLDSIDLALVMTVEPGFGGQSFMADMMPKVTKLRETINKKKLSCWIQVDGGVTLETAVQAAAAGADSLVAGSAVFRAADPAAQTAKIADAAQKAFEKRTS
jgi:ribulose-phosphate 3-epimerase